MNFNKQEVFKTALIVWLLVSTGYVFYDLYDGWKVKGMQASYKQGYADSVGEMIVKIKNSACQPIEIRKGDQAINVIGSDCQFQNSSPQPVK